MVIGPLALRHSSIEMGAIIFPGIQNVTMLRYTSHAQGMDLNIDMNFSMRFSIHTFGGMVFYNTSVVSEFVKTKSRILKCCSSMTDLCTF